MMRGFKLQTRSGWFARPERIGNFRFPANYHASLADGTIYLSRQAALQDCHRFHLAATARPVAQTPGGWVLTDETPAAAAA